MTERKRIAVAVTGAANTASVLAGLKRTGAEPFLTTDADEVQNAAYAVLPGVGAFGPVRERLAQAGLDRAFRERVRRGAPTLGTCLGMQLFCEGSEEAPGVPGLGLVPGIVRRYPSSLPVPQLGWNRVFPAAEGGRAGTDRRLVEPGWAYFANSYRLEKAPAGFTAWKASYGDDFVAALEGASPGALGLLLCQFHSELSGTWGLSLLRRWLGLDDPAGASGAPMIEAATGSDAAGTAIRVVPCLDIKDGRVFKGRRFKNLVDSGDPEELAARYEAEGADELAMLDITATIEGRKSSLEALRRVRARLGIPILMGGGLRVEEDAAALVDAGADRVTVNSAAVLDPGLIDSLARRFGCQCVVLAIDARSTAKPLTPVNGEAVGEASDSERAAYRAAGSTRRWNVVVEAGRRDTGIDAVAWAAEGARRGAGEILLTSIDRDGTGEGFDLELVEAVARSSGLPVIASGGAADVEHFSQAARAGARAVLAAGAFHRGELSVADVKRHLNQERIGVRL